MTSVTKFLKERPPKEGYTHVLRVELDEDPFMGSNLDNCRGHWHNLPPPWRDTPSHDLQLQEVCGTAHTKQFRKWFPKKALSEEHLSVSEHQFLIMEVPEKHHKKLSTQVVFRRRSAKVIARFDPLSLKVLP